jgi:hypothetical protein
MTTPDQPDRALSVRGARRAVRIVVLCLAVAAILFLAVIGWISGR